MSNPFTLYEERRVLTEPGRFNDYMVLIREHVWPAIEKRRYAAFDDVAHRVAVDTTRSTRPNDRPCGAGRLAAVAIRC